MSDKATELSPARALAMRFWEIRTIAGAEDLPAWDELTPYERSRKVKSAEHFITNNIAGPIEEKAVKAERQRIQEALEKILDEFGTQAGAYNLVALLGTLDPSGEQGEESKPELPPQRNAKGGLTTFGLYVRSLRWAVHYIDKSDERPSGTDDDWMEWAAAHDLLKDATATPATSKEGS